MASLPRYGEPKVNQEPVPAQRLPVEAPPAAFGLSREADAAYDQTQRALGDIEGVALLEKKKADQVASMDAWNQLERKKTALISSFYQKKMKDALAVPDSVKTDWRKSLSDVERGLSSDTQRQAFRRLSLSTEAELDKALQLHVARERESYYKHVSNETIASFMDKAQREPEYMEEYLGMARATLQDMAEREGADPKWVDNEALQLNSRAHTNRIETLLAEEQFAKARAHFETYKEQLLPNQVSRLEALTRQGKDVDEMHRESDRIWAMGLGPKEMIQEAEKLQGDLRKRVTNDLKERLAFEHQAQKLDQDRRFEAGAARIRDMNVSGKAQNAMEAIGLTEWEKLEEREKQALEKMFAASRGTGGFPEKSDARALARFYGYSRNDFLRMTNADMLREFYPTLSEAHFKMAMDRWQQAHDDNDKARENFDDWTNTNQMLYDVMAEAKLGDSGAVAGRPVAEMYTAERGNETAANVYHRFQEEFRARAAGLKRDPQGRVNPLLAREEARKLALELKQKVTFDRIIDKDVSLIDLTEENIQDETFAIKPEVLKAYYDMAKGVTGGPSPSTSQDKWYEQARSRVNRAFVADLKGASNAEILNILTTGSR